MGEDKVGGTWVTVGDGVVEAAALGVGSVRGGSVTPDSAEGVATEVIIGVGGGTELVVGFESATRSGVTDRSHADKARIMKNKIQKRLANIAAFSRKSKQGYESPTMWGSGFILKI